MVVKSVSIYKAEEGLVVYTKLQSGETKKDLIPKNKMLSSAISFPGELY